MRLKKEICILIKRILEHTEITGPFIEVPLYLNDSGDYRNKNNIIEKPDLYKNIDIINNYEVFELLNYMQRKGIIKEVKDILGYADSNENFEILTRSEFRKKNKSETRYERFTVLITTSKYDMLEFLEDSTERMLIIDK